MEEKISDSLLLVFKTLKTQIEDNHQEFRRALLESGSLDSKLKDVIEKQYHESIKTYEITYKELMSLREKLVMVEDELQDFRRKKALRKPSFALETYRTEVLEIFSRSKFKNLRVFGPIVHGEDEEGDSVDFLMDGFPEVTFLELCGLQSNLEGTLGVPIRLIMVDDLEGEEREEALLEARPV